MGKKATRVLTQRTIEVRVGETVTIEDVSGNVVIVKAVASLSPAEDKG